MEFDIDIALKMEEIFALERNQKCDEKDFSFLNRCGTGNFNCVIG